MTPEEIATNVLAQFYSKYDIVYKIHDHSSLQLTRYFNFRLKFIDLRPRSIQISDELNVKLNQGSYEDAIFDIIRKTGKGMDINPYQSRESFNADYHDRLFNDWGIHHLHLSTTKKKPMDYFYARSGPLLFARFTPTVAYLLDVKFHNAINVWSDRDFLRIIIRNWPESIAHAKHPTIFEPDLDDAQIAILRKKGYLFGVNVDGAGYMLLGHGQATSGDNIMAGRMAGEVWRWVGEHLDLLSQNQSGFEAGLKQQLGM
jgi:hypothetical protein